MYILQICIMSNMNILYIYMYVYIPNRAGPADKTTKLWFPRLTQQMGPPNSGSLGWLSKWHHQILGPKADSADGASKFWFPELVQQMRPPSSGSQG